MGEEVMCFSKGNSKGINGLFEHFFHIDSFVPKDEEDSEKQARSRSRQLPG
jgi:hypothetical protein